MKKTNRVFHKLLLMLMTINFNHTIYADTKVTCVFKNTAEFPVIFTSFQDNNSKAIETKYLNSSESFTSNVLANQTVTYDVQPNIQTFTRSKPSNLSGAQEINYDLFHNSFLVKTSSYTNADPSSQNAILSTVQITNRSSFPVNIIMNYQDSGQSVQPGSTPYQAINQTMLPVNGFFASTDRIESLTINSDVKGFNSKPLLIAAVKSRCEILNYHGKIKILMK